MSYDVVTASTQYFTATAPLSDEPCFISAWVNPDNVSNTFDWVSLTDASGFFADFFTMRQASQQIRAHAQLSSGTNSAATTGNVVTADSWQHVIVVFASDTSRTVYYNLTTSATDTTSIAVTAANVDTISIGALKQASPLNPCDGQIAEVVLARGVPSFADMAMLYAGFTPEFMPTLELYGWWPLREDYNDHSGNGYHLTPVNTPTISTANPKIQGLDQDDDLAWAKDHLFTRVRPQLRALRAS